MNNPTYQTHIPIASRVFPHSCGQSFTLFAKLCQLINMYEKFRNCWNPCRQATKQKQQQQHQYEKEEGEQQQQHKVGKKTGGDRSMIVRVDQSNSSVDHQRAVRQSTTWTRTLKAQKTDSRMFQ